MPFKPSGGRPKKYQSQEEAKKADLKKRQLRRQRAQLLAGPVDFIAYEPPHPDAPTDTPLSGLRTGSNIRIPLDVDLQIDVLANLPPISPPPTQLPLSSDDVEMAQQIIQIRIDEQETNSERVEYEAEISQQLNEIDATTAHILMGMRSANTTSVAKETRASETNEERLADGLATTELQTMEGSNTADESEKIYDEEPLYSCFSTVASMDEPITTRDNDSIDASNASNKLENIQRSLQTPPQLRSPSLQSSSQSNSKRSTSRRSTPFPSQKNNLISWMTPLPQRLPVNHNTSPPLVIQRSSTNASSSPVETMIYTTSAPSTPIPTPVSIAIASLDSPISMERTAFKLAKQLRNFQGCTHEQHYEAAQLHHEHHQRSDVHSECSSLQQITTFLNGGYVGGAPLPNVLSSPKLMKPGDYNGLNCQAAFEGTSISAAPQDVGTRNENLPKNLCLSQHHTISRKNRRPKVMFDIDSTCCFPTSLAFARRGINWLPKAHPILNLTADIHFGLRVPIYNDHNVLTSKYTPLHKVPHYCFGTAIGMDPLSILIFFPALHLESDYEHTAYLSKQDNQLFHDAIVGPAITKIIGSSNIIQHYPASAKIADLDSTAISAEGLARKESTREQLVKHAIQPQYLDALWSLILQTINENPGFHRFQGATLFAHSKNIKLEFMDMSLTQAYDGWQAKWSEVTDSQFYNQDRTFVDLAKQVTSEDSALPYDHIPEDHEAEVFLWKKCCLEAYAKNRMVLNANGSHVKGNPKRTTYPWAMMRDTTGQTMFAVPHGQESRDGLIYSQFYMLIKTPFDSSKVYIFNNDSIENLALDPGYIRSLQQEGGGITFSKAVCEFGYLHSKKRAHANLVDNCGKSYGIREEHRISLTMMEEVYQQWQQWDLYDDEADIVNPILPYYIVPTRELLDFLSAQINKYCFLFEHVLAHTAMTYSLPETLVMVTALRALRFCYGSNLIQRESLLYKNRWEQMRGPKQIIKEGLGMQDTIERCGLGWFLPKFNWVTWRLAPPHGDNILVGNMLMHEEYKRRWRAVKDLRDVYVRFNQAESWYDRYNVQHSAPLLNKWLEYLHALNLEQFDIDIWKTMLKSHKRSPELTAEAIKQKGDIQFCQNHMKRMFSVNGVIGPPHFVTGNKMRFERVVDLLDFLFLWEDGKERRGWGNKPYRIILQKTFELVERRLGYRRADQWLDEFFHLIRLTHWILPYPSNSTFIMSTKTNHNQGLKGRMMWFSVVYVNPEKVELPLCSHSLTLYNILWDARRQTFDNGRDHNIWSTSQLITACRAQGLKIYGQEETEEFWIAGKRSIGLKGFAPVWERTQPPRLKILNQIKNQSLDELEDLMSGFSQEYIGDDIHDNSINVSSNEQEVAIKIDERSIDTRRSSQSRSIMAAFARKSNDEENEGSELSRSVTTITNTSGSVFIPSNNEK